MQAADWFGLGMRVIVVVIFASGLEILLDSGLFKLGYFNLLESSPGYFLLNGLARVVAGFLLFRGAPLLIELAYPNLSEDDYVDEE